MASPGWNDEREPARSARMRCRGREVLERDTPVSPSRKPLAKNDDVGGGNSTEADQVAPTQRQITNGAIPAVRSEWSNRSAPGMPIRTRERLDWDVVAADSSHRPACIAAGRNGIGGAGCAPVERHARCLTCERGNGAITPCACPRVTALVDWCG